MIYKYKVWNGREMVSPDYITRNGIAFWKEDSIQCQSQKIVQFTGITDKFDEELYSGDIIEGHDGQKYRIYAPPGGFAIKAPYWASDRTDLTITDELIIQPLANVQTASYIRGSCHKIGNIYANPELLKP
jgi:hypothetical protein